ncbi:MAG TPA: multifunctional CCA addition/repair protein [Steroidobacteraceae bacterium]|nr:multifunctional CCA addition/repair protein [Steroidobacteraceae bacterium]
MQVYLVGGAVRDKLLGRPVKERDWVVVGATPADLEAQGYQAVGREFPVFLHPETHDEYALARLEKKVGPGYRGFITEFSPDVTLEEDLRRRDLTINAMAEDANGVLIDPHGGRHDLDARVLRHVSSAFVEDPVRILRLARFTARYASLGFRVADDTLALMREMVAAGEVDALVPERVWAETVRALAEPNPERYIEVLRDCGALAVILPELDALFGVPQPEKWHPEIDTGLHQLLALQQSVRLGGNERVRFAVLAHDLGKGLTPPDQWPSHRGHEETGAALVEVMCERLRVPNDFRELALLATRFHTHVHRALELRPATLLELLEHTDAFRRPERFAELLVVCEADSRGRTGLEYQPYPQRAYMAAARARAAAI